MRTCHGATPEGAVDVNVAVRQQLRAGVHRGQHDQVAPLFERLETLETVTDLNQVTRLLEPRVLPSQTAERMAAAKIRTVAGKEETSWVP